MALPRCPEVLPIELSALIESFGAGWAASVFRPSPQADVMAHWDTLLAAWVADAELPLFVRKPRGNRGSELVHASGRKIVPTDSSPAHWAYMLASAGERPTLDNIREWLLQDALPVVFVQPPPERSRAKYHCKLAKRYDVNQHKWKLAHIESVGLNSRTDLTKVPLERLISQFVKLVSPSNMFVVPKAWAGMAEVRAVIQAISSVNK